MLLITFIVDLT